MKVGCKAIALGEEANGYYCCFNEGDEITCIKEYSDGDFEFVDQDGTEQTLSSSGFKELTQNTIQLNRQYTSKNGQKWECIAIRGEVAWLSVVDGDDAYRFKLDGTNLSYGFGAWDIKWEPVIEWRTNTAHLCDDGGSYHMGAGESGSYSGGVTVTIKYPVVDGKPDFTQATVTPASDS